MPTGALGIALLAILLLPPHRGTLPPALVLPLSLLALVLVRPMAASQGFSPQPQLATVRFLRSLEVSQPLTILEAEGGFHIYLRNGTRRVAEFEKDRPFDAFLADRGINAVVLTPRLMAFPALAQDPEWRRLIADPADRGFVALPVPGVSGRTLLIRRDLLNGG